MTKPQMINEIIGMAQISGTGNIGDIFFSLAFITEKELIKICNDLGIKCE